MSYSEQEHNDSPHTSTEILFSSMLGSTLNPENEMGISDIHSAVNSLPKQHQLKSMPSSLEFSEGHFICNPYRFVSP